MNWSHNIQEGEEDDDDEYLFGDEVENNIVQQYLEDQEASRSRWRCNPDALSRWPNKRDHAAGDAQICIYYFIANLVYSPTHFRRRYV
jgi:hypothetical protein